MTFLPVKSYCSKKVLMIVGATYHHMGKVKFGFFRKTLIFKGFQHNTHFFSFLLNMPYNPIIKFIKKINKYLDCMNNYSFRALNISFSYFSLYIFFQIHKKA